MRRDLACAALGLAAAAAYYAAAAALPESLLADDVGADGLPRALAGLLALLSLVIGAKALIAGVGGEGLPLRQHLRALGVAAIAAAYVAVVPFLGFAPSIALLLLAAMHYYGAKRSPATLLQAVAGAAVLWLVFSQLLGRAA